MTKEQIARINALAAKSRQGNLTDEEKAEQSSLRKQYLDEVKASLRAQLDAARVQNPDGTVSPLYQKNKSRRPS